ncbi:phospholipase C, phosphocholine-specific [Chitinophaga polysaccharea]|uniref:phosphocholine-specific phospholipase C n=1 Tax=Chitinophaga TaxID=79328 RepID=UPI0014559208|nr:MULTISPECIES: phospholipase C, phosphocholine-specific [Chitinophaga]NLR57859.1 phospholipase C, phosphocholine-specific [Chitinophaga polysaccharea]NLU93452.1 phospholipase C, phosphocholine-specific [Chitinophaga sp. Ak27]
MDSRRDFLKQSLLLSGAAGLSTMIPASIQKALAIDPAPGSTFLDAEHIVILMQENRSFDHCFGSLQGVRGFNDPRANNQPNQHPVWFQTNEHGDTYAPFRLNIRDTKATWMGDLPHSRPSQVDAYNRGRYDKWLIAKRPGNREYTGMPLTMGYYTREDLPFNYAMADAFTVCDQHFCSAMTSTTPNRSFFWTGKIIHPEDGIPKAHIRNDDYSYGKLPWKTFPELLEENKVPWKFYQNEISCGGGFKGEERAWLANFGCNLLEFFAAYNVKFSERYINGLLKQVDTLPDEINKLQEASPSSDEAAAKIRTDIAKKQAVLDNATRELAKWNKESYAKLTPYQQSLYQRAFVVNSADPSYRKVTQVTYQDGATEREITVPAGDVLHQFRADVNSGKLPMVSWLAGPQNFSDHPSAPWYGAWYVSEILDILTQNPEVWKKTIFIVTYDENDGYFDHVVPFSICDNNNPGTGKCSAGIDTEVEQVRLAHELKQGVSEKQAREAPVGLGFRVPLMIASPWSRGGKVCSQVFEHTSTLQFLETFINKKLHKQVHLDNISQWRRTISGDLTSVFSPFNSSTPDKQIYLNQRRVVENINNAKFKEVPTGFKKVSGEDIAAFKRNQAPGLGQQERGTRPSCALPYELLADGQWQQEQLVLKMQAGKRFFGSDAMGAPFRVYTSLPYTDAQSGQTENGRSWAFAVAAGDTLTYEWPVKAFADGHYHLHLHGPNGFYREFAGTASHPQLELQLDYDTTGKLTTKPTGNVVLRIANNGSAARDITITDNAYGARNIQRRVDAGKTLELLLPLQKSKGWYDFSVTVNGADTFLQRYAGRVETGKEGITDPFMGA